MCLFEYACTSLEFILSGAIIKSGDMKYIKNEGMSRNTKSLDKGRLVVTFDVQFPENNWQTSEKLEAIKECLLKT